MKLCLPIIFLGYDEERLFSVADERERSMIPVFMDAELAEEYRVYYEKHYDLKLQALLSTEPAVVINILQCIMLVDPNTEYLTIDPDLPTFTQGKSECYSIREVIAAVADQYLKPDPHNPQDQTGGNGRRPQKPKA